jgi:hypothetical protein
MSLRIGIDIDGVLADFRAGFHASAERCLGRELPDAADPGSGAGLDQKDVKRVWQHVARTPNWWTALAPYEPGQIARLYALARNAGWEVFFLTNRPASAGDTVQFQTASWLEQQGFYLPAVLTVPGSRGEVANGLRLDLVIDDLVVNCVDAVSASTAKALLMLRSADQATTEYATDRGIGVVATFAEALVIVERLHHVMPGRRGRLLRLADWFWTTAPAQAPLPQNPRAERPIPPFTRDET